MLPKADGFSPFVSVLLKNQGTERQPGLRALGGHRLIYIHNNYTPFS